jgi:hypothetical protein
MEELEERLKAFIKEMEARRERKLEWIKRASTAEGQWLAEAEVEELEWVQQRLEGVINNFNNGPKALGGKNERTGKDGQGSCQGAATVVREGVEAGGGVCEVVVGGSEG